jgi:hypothetical protein
LTPMDSISYVRQSVTVFLGHYPWCFFEGEWVRYTMASDVGFSNIGWAHDSHEFSSISEKAKIG